MRSTSWRVAARTTSSDGGLGDALPLFAEIGATIDLATALPREVSLVAVVGQAGLEIRIAYAEACHSAAEGAEGDVPPGLLGDRLEAHGMDLKTARSTSDATARSAGIRTSAT